MKGNAIMLGKFLSCSPSSAMSSGVRAVSARILIASSWPGDCLRIARASFRASFRSPTERKTLASLARLLKIARGEFPCFDKEGSRAKRSAFFKPDEAQLLIGGRILGI